MKFSHVIQLSEAQFRRITGVKKSTFSLMREIVANEHVKKKSRGGRPNKLSVEDMILMTLEYLREYRTYIHIGSSFGISESNAYQTIRWVETVLVQSKAFKLPGKKALLKSDYEFEVILIDATESPIERPKKNSVTSIQEKRKDTQ